MCVEADSAEHPYLALCEERGVRMECKIVSEDLRTQEEDHCHRPGSLELVDVDLVNELAEAARLNCRPPLLEQMCLLSKRCFNEDGLRKALDGGWQMTFLKETCSDGSMALQGYICYELWPTAEFHIRRVAVAEGQRGRGFGQKLMHLALAKAARIPRSKCGWITLSALNSAVTFYEKLDFTDMGCGDPRAERGHTWMELKNASAVLDGRETDVAEDTDVAEEDAVSWGSETDVDEKLRSDEETCRSHRESK
jgi:ribosomal protein S18 acetylase RimI-like enzyme